MKKFLFFLLFIPALSNAQFQKKIDSVFQYHVKENSFSGNLLIAKNGKTILEKSAGFADEKTNIPNQSTTLFSIGSIVKRFTADLILQLVQENKLNLNVPVKEYIPGYNLPNADRITLHHLLTHSSGLGDYMASSEIDQMMGKQATLDDLMKIVVKRPLEFNVPGSKVEYSNSGFIVLGRIIELQRDKNYFQILKEKILQPSGMKSATFEYDLSKPNFSKGYVQTENRNWQAEINITPPASDGGLFCTAQDLLSYDNALFGYKIVTPASLKMATSKQEDRFGYSMIITQLNNGVGYGHNGGLPGYEAEYRHFVIGQDSYTVIVLANHDRKAVPLFFDILKIIEKQ